MSRARFQIGQVLTTHAALEVANHADILGLLARHASGDWGDCDPADAKANDRALKTGERVFSVYKLREGVKIWIITEATYEGRRMSSVVMTPSDY